MSQPTVGVFTPYLDAAFERPFLRGLQHAADEHGVRLVVFVGGQSNGDNPDERRFNTCYKLASRASVDGLIVPVHFMANMLDSEQLASFFQRYRDIPTISVFRKIDGVHGVTYASSQALRAILAHLIGDHGCRRIALAADKLNATEFCETYRAVCTESGLPVDEKLILAEIGLFEDSGDTAIEELFTDRRVQPDAIVTTSALVAAGVSRSLQNRGVRIPRDLRLATLSNDEFPWPITMAVQPLPELGAQALSLVRSLLRGEKIPQWTTMPYQRPLIVRGSCGCTGFPASRPRSGSPRSEAVDSAADLARTLGVQLSNATLAMQLLYGTLGELLAGGDPRSLPETMRRLLTAEPAIRRAPLALSPVLYALARRARGELSVAVDDEKIEEACLGTLSALVQEIFVMEEEHEYLDYTELNRVIHRNLLHLATATNVEELRRPLSRAAQQLGFSHFSLCHYEGGQAPSERSRRIFALDTEIGPELRRDSTVFPTLELVPGGVRSMTSAGHCVVLPLFTNAEIGFMVLPFHVRDMHHYRPLREQIASALGTATLFRSVQRHAESIAFINRKLKEEMDQRTRLRDALVQSQKMEALGRVAGGVAHDFNNLLAIILGNSSFINVHYRNDELLQQRAQAISDAAGVAATLTKQLLTFARKHVFDLESLDLNDIVRSMLPLIKATVDRCGLESDLADGPLMVVADKAQMEQVVINLIVNARDAMPHGGTLTIRCRRAHRRDIRVPEIGQLEAASVAVLSVSDTGCGMDEDVQRRAFEPFFTTKGSDKGMGMGLATVYGIVKQSKGAVHIDSSPGQGTCFSIYFPCAPGDETPRELEEALPIATDRQLSILLVDEEQSLRMLTAELLCQEGHTVIEASDGQEAEIVARNHDGTFDLIITGVDLPYKSGPEIVSEIRKSRPEMKAILISDSVGAAPPHNSGDLFLRKPYSVDTLVEALRHTFGERMRPS